MRRPQDKFGDWERDVLLQRPGRGLELWVGAIALGRLLRCVDDLKRSILGHAFFCPYPNPYEACPSRHRREQDSTAVIGARTGMETGEGLAEWLVNDPKEQR